jgi:hypothetical protein
MLFFVPIIACVPGFPSVAGGVLPVAGNPAVVDISAGADVLSAFIPAIACVLAVTCAPVFTSLPALVDVPFLDYSSLFQVAMILS